MGLGGAQEFLLNRGETTLLTDGSSITTVYRLAHLVTDKLGVAF